MMSYPKMHVSLYVSELNKTVNFYNAFFGQDPKKVKPGYAKYHLDEPGLVISFIENGERVQSNFGHLGFQVESQEAMMKALEVSKKLDLVSKEEIGTACCYAVQDKFWATDPDGHQWEVYYFHEDSEFNDPVYATEDAAACCTPQQKTEKKKVPLSELACCEPNSGCC